MSDTFWIALIAALSSILSAALLSFLNNRNLQSQKAQDYKRQDDVADKLLARQDEVAALLLERQDASRAAVVETARLLKTNTEISAAATEETQKQLREIHVLVNSNMTAAMQSELDATRARVVSLLEIVEMKKTAGHEPSVQTLAIISEAEKRIVDLQALLTERLRIAEASMAG